MTFQGLLLRCAEITSSTWLTVRIAFRASGLHRTIDVGLIGLSTVSIAAFLLGACSDSPDAALQHWALVDLHLWQMSIVLSLQAAAVGFAVLSLMTWVLVAVATPAPIYIAEVALAQAPGSPGSDS